MYINKYRVFFPLTIFPLDSRMINTYFLCPEYNRVRVPDCVHADIPVTSRIYYKTSLNSYFGEKQ